MALRKLYCASLNLFLKTYITPKLFKDQIRFLMIKKYNSFISEFDYETRSIGVLRSVNLSPGFKLIYVSKM